MSLINEALKKAQKAHSEGMAPPPPMGQSHAPSHSMGKGQLVKIFFVAVIVLGIFGSAVAFLVLGLIGDKEQEPAGAQASIASASAVAPPAPDRPASTQDVIPVNVPKPAQPLPVPKTKSAPTPLNTIAQSAPPPPKAPEPVPVQPQPKEIPKARLKGFALVRQTVAKGSANADIVDSVVESAAKAPPPVAPKPAPAAAVPQTPPAPAQISPTPIPQPTIVTPRPVAQTQPRPPPVARPQPSAPPAAPAQNPVVLEFIEKMVIQGVRLSGTGTNSKVLMDNKVYRLNSFVNHDLKLRIISVNKERIIFVDYAGVQYAKFY